MCCRFVVGEVRLSVRVLLFFIIYFCNKRTIYRISLCELRTYNDFSYSLQVKIWFQNRRMKWRNSKERELLSNGAGNRDTTIPSKDNPHPDLTDTPDSDVDESNELADDRGHVDESRADSYHAQHGSDTEAK